MRIYSTLIIGIMAWLVAFAAFAAPTTERSINEVNGVDFANPTTRTDGSVFDPATEQKAIRLYCAVDGGDYVAIADYSTYDADVIATVTIDNSTCTLTAVDNDDLESGFMDPPFRYNAPPGLIKKL